MPAPARRAATAGYDRGISALSAVSHRHYPVERTPIVVGTGRSGTTYLQELISAAPRSYPVFEPLSPARDPAVAALREPGGFLLRAPDAPDAHLRSLLEQIMRGRRLTRWSTRLRRTEGLVRAERFVMKEVRMTRAVGWVARNFPGNRLVAIVRHPCAVVSSMLNARGEWRDWTSDHVAVLLRGGYEDQAVELLRDEQPQVVRLAAFWAAETSDLLAQTTPATALLVTYEDLVVDPAATMARVFDHLHVVPPPSLEGAIERPSAMSTPLSAVRSGGDSLTTWRDRLTAAERDLILGTVAAFGLEAYGPDPVPDLDALHASHASSGID